ncbi:MAG: TetR/AcrR family transcriptional regulator [Acidimicrobiales bacterium]
MGRPPKFSEDEMLDAAGELLVSGGEHALTASAVARSLSAPSGSVYHRFASRDHLAAALWLRTVERFDGDVVVGLSAPGDPVAVGVAVAGLVVEWCVANPLDAHVLTGLSMADLTEGTMPADVVRRAQALRRKQRRAIEHLAARLDLPADQVSFAVAAIPHAAVRRAVGDRQPIPPWTAPAVERAARAVLTDETTP